MGKTYWAVVEGGPETDEGRIEIGLSKRDESRGWWMKADPHGLPSVTTWKVMGRLLDPSPAGAGSARSGGVGAGGEDASDVTPPGAFGTTLPFQGRDKKALTWLALEPLTGRTHQLRVHCAEMGFPIVGDTVYGNAARDDGQPLHLHAREVTVPISKNKPPVTVTAPVPEHMRELLSTCGWKGD